MDLNVALIEAKPDTLDANNSIGDDVYFEMEGRRQID